LRIPIIPAKASAHALLILGRTCDDEATGGRQAFLPAAVNATRRFPVSAYLVSQVEVLHAQTWENYRIRALRVIALSKEPEDLVAELVGVLEQEAVPRVAVKDDFGVGQALRHRVARECGDHYVVGAVRDQHGLR
jgi:hypothetical protein